MTTTQGFYQPTKPNAFNRGEIWMVDFANPIGTELGLEHPAVIVSTQELNNAATKIGRVIVVPGTSKQTTNSQGKTISMHLEIIATPSNGLHHTTYFMSEQVRSASILHFRRLVGVLERTNLREIENRLCLVMGLFK